MNLKLTALIILFVLVNIELSAQVLKNYTHVKVDKSKKTTTTTIRIQVNDKESNNISKVQIGHSSKQKFKLLEAKVLDLDGKTLKKLKKKDVKSKSNMSYGTFYQDDLIQEFDLFWNTYPHQIEYSYQITQKEFIQIAYWYPLNDTSLPTNQSTLIVESPIDYKIRYSFSDDIKFEKDVKQDIRTLTWTYAKCEITTAQAYQPPLEEILPSVKVVPVHFKYGKSGSQNSWSSLGKWQNDLNEKTDELPVSEQIVVEKLIKGLDTDLEKIEVLYHYLQDQTKYINVSIDVGGLKSYPAEYVAKNKYGDCKALTTYMKALLKYADIPSYYTKIRAGEKITRIDKKFPSSQFNHVVLVVPVENDTIWMENTTTILPFGYLGTFIQGRQALLTNGKKSKIVNTPSLDSSDVLEVGTFHFNQDKLNKCDFAVSQEVKGKKFEQYLYYKNYETSQSLEKFIVADLNIKGIELKKWDIKTEDRNADIVHLQTSGDCHSLIRNIGSLKVLYQNYISIPNFETPKQRHEIVRIDYPRNIRNTTNYKIEDLENFEIRLPEAIQLTSKYGSYITSFKSTSNTITFKEHFYLKKGEYPIDEYSEFYEFISSIFQYQNQSQIILK